jgi:hypothetical protein
MTYQILYASVSTTPMQADELEDLLEHAQGRNASQGITGALVYVEGRFLQVLEGDKTRVHALMQTISDDLRHEHVSILQAGEVPAAAFADWTMAYVSATAAEVAAWAGLSAATTLPAVWDEVRQDPQRARRLAESILALVADGPLP